MTAEKKMIQTKFFDEKRFSFFCLHSLFDCGNKIRIIHLKFRLFTSTYLECLVWHFKKHRSPLIQEKKYPELLKCTKTSSCQIYTHE